MTQSEVEQLLVRVVCGLQEISGRERVEVTSKTRPISDLPGFDSLNGVEATVEVCDELKLDFEFNNVFAADDKALTISQAAARIVEHQAQVTSLKN